MPARRETEPPHPTPALFRAINEARSSQGLTALHIDSTLSLVARRAVARYIASESGSEQRVAAAANAELRAVSLLYDSVFSQVLYVDSFGDAPAVLQHAMEPRMASVGIAVERFHRSHDPSGPSGYGVVVILGENRAGAWYVQEQQP
jgi:hypothetical protein